MATAPNCIIVYLGEDESRYKSVFDAAVETARSSEARVILYDADAASVLGASPLPTWWSADGERELVGDKLSPEGLERAGCAAMARQVRHARSLGIDAWGWLPSSRRAKHLAEYADQEGADLLIVPSDLEDVGILGRLKGEPTAEEIAESAERQVLVVDVSGDPAGTHAVTPEAARIRQRDA